MTKVLISMPDDLLERVDREAAAKGTSRSRFLQDAARRELGAPSGERIAAALARGRDALAGAGSFESAELIREGRRSRDAADRRL
jgi:hypothetical protein